MDVTYTANDIKIKTTSIGAVTRKQVNLQGKI